MVRDVRFWLEAWVDENLVDIRYRREKSALAREALNCRAAAKTDGISSTELCTACDGDLLQFLFERQVVMVDQERSRLVEP